MIPGILIKNFDTFFHLIFEKRKKIQKNHKIQKYFLFESSVSS